MHSEAALQWAVSVVYELSWHDQSALNAKAATAQIGGKRKTHASIVLGRCHNVKSIPHPKASTNEKLPVNGACGVVNNISLWTVRSRLHSAGLPHAGF